MCQECLPTDESVAPEWSSVRALVCHFSECHLRWPVLGSTPWRPPSRLVLRNCSGEEHRLTGVGLASTRLTPRLPGCGLPGVGFPSAGLTVSGRWSVPSHPSTFALVRGLSSSSAASGCSVRNRLSIRSSCAFLLGERSARVSVLSRVSSVVTSPNRLSPLSGGWLVGGLLWSATSSLELIRPLVVCLVPPCPGGDAVADSRSQALSWLSHGSRRVVRRVTAAWECPLCLLTSHGGEDVLLSASPSSPESVSAASVTPMPFPLPFGVPELARVCAGYLGCPADESEPWSVLRLPGVSPECLQSDASGRSEWSRVCHLFEWNTLWSASFSLLVRCRDSPHP